jgi:predicted unusual protein kinase regulating ubiquinone biosynthesis (AarF/ABC1/UbiB family)
VATWAGGGLAGWLAGWLLQHPGNLLVRRPLRPFQRPFWLRFYLCDVCSCQEILRRNGRGQVDERGRLVLIDFGLCAEVQRVDSAAMTRAIVNLMRGDVEGLLEDAITLRFLPRDVDREALLPELRAIFAKVRVKRMGSIRIRTD